MGKRKAPLTFCNGAFCFSQCLYAKRFGLFAAPVNIVGVEQLVCLVTVGLAEELLIQLGDGGVLVGLPDGLGTIFAIGSGSSCGLGIYLITGTCINIGLTAAGYAAAGASHDLDKVVVLVACLDLIEQLAGVCGSVYDRYVYIHACYVYGCFLDAVEAAYAVVLDGLEILTGEDVGNGTQSSFHNAAGYAEDDACAGGIAEDGVELFIGEIDIVDACLLDHPCKLTGGEVGIYVTVAFSAHLGTDDLELLCGAGHYGYYEDVLGIETVLFCKVGLGDGTLHLVRALAGGEVRNELGIEMLAVLDPAGRAGGDHRENTAVVYPVEKLRAFFHDGEVGGEVNVEYSVCAEPSHGGGELAGGGGADGHAEFFTDRYTHGGSGLEYNELVGIVESRPDCLGGILFGECARGAGCDTLTAVYAGDFGKILAEGRTYHGLEAAVLHSDSKYTLGVFAGGNAATAENALIVISYDAGRYFVDGFDDTLAFKLDLGDAKLFGKSLKLAVMIALAGEAGTVMV